MSTWPVPHPTDWSAKQDRDFWAFRTPKKPPVPVWRTGPGARISNPIDAFLLKALEAKSLEFSPRSRSLTLVRRVAYDLPGVAPTWTQVEMFLSDKQPGAYARMVTGFWPADTTANAGGGTGSIWPATPIRKASGPRPHPSPLVAVPRLRDPRVQQRQALRPFFAGTDRRRRTGPMWPAPRQSPRN
ncbi:MAG: hypothetical protein Ct9H300mP1_05000 [Planctomycetaceae bacterium]|nr:MAG: hypothetical protein Ct9H300mP1_05000 [Planctomycetaceae bacterium]